MGDFKKLKVWKAARELTIEVYQATAGFPGSEAFGLTAQMRRAAGSIASNIAEGCGRNTDGELARFTRISLGSAAELESHLLLARDLGLTEEVAADRLGEKLRTVQRMLARLHTRAHQPPARR